MIEFDNPDATISRRTGEEANGPRIRGADALQAGSPALDRPLNDALEKIARLASRLLNVPFALVDLMQVHVARRPQHADSSQGQGLPEGLRLPDRARIHSSNGDVPPLQPLARKDIRKALKLCKVDRSLQAGGDKFNFYTAVPLTDREGRQIGQFCIFDHESRTLGESEVAILEDLADIAADEIKLLLTEPPAKKESGQSNVCQTLVETQERYQTLIGLLSDWHWEMDADLRFCLVAQANDLRMADRQCAFIGKTLRELPGLNMAEKDWAPVNEALRRRRSFQDLMLKWRDQNGRARCTAISGQPVFSSAGDFTGYRGVSKDVTENMRAMEEMAQANAALRELSVGYQAFREAERKRIAHELHDELAQLLATSRMELCLLQQDLRPQPDSSRRLRSLDQMIGSSIVSLRRLATDLRPSSLDEGGLYYALRTFLKTFRETEGIDCQLIANEADLNLDEARSTTIFRLIQESLVNVRRHAGAGKVSIHIYRSGKRLELRIQDDGKGIRAEDMKKERAYGLLDMRSRVAEMNGKIDIKGRPGKGTRIAVTLPLFK